MTAYVRTSGTVFGLIVVAHIVRVFAEGPHVLIEPAFAFTSVLSIGLSIWAVRLLRRGSRSRSRPKV